MSDSPVRRTALEVEVFLINHMDGTGQPQEWEEFTSPAHSGPEDWKGYDFDAYN